MRMKRCASGMPFVSVPKEALEGAGSRDARSGHMDEEDWSVPRQTLGFRAFGEVFP
jgi:hypothetical protein